MLKSCMSSRSISVAVTCDSVVSKQMCFLCQQLGSNCFLLFYFPYRFVLCANHMEVKGFLGRYLRRKLVEAEIRTGIRNNDVNRVVDWIPKVWAHLNKALESHSSADVTIGKSFSSSALLLLFSGGNNMTLPAVLYIWYKRVSFFLGCP